ncbi:glycosyltransferase family 39 protein [Halogeometricum limi]|uniref:Dolichyl-phosphate-mannose-protein mannosyltransferase n=1 Tax=Halogeometricum limi TaxID=555875 RepID=A0A1I6HTJ9_9EURY|nr:glycosyltransferase family 39 protein [Halogeometricum limi]SFR57754.1 Dolichyl-phosphate-mannose-protein mannosyltransferase [Halogeometricum limi]
MYRRRWAPVVAVVAVGAALRLYGIGSESLWTDELITLAFVQSMTAGELLTTIPRVNPHPPLYYVLLDLWVGAFGTTETALRLPSTLFGVLSIPALYLLGRRIGDHTVGLVAALLLALSPFHVRYAQEVRMYALFVFLVVASFLLVHAVADRRSRRPRHRRGLLAAWVLSCLLLVGTHYFGGFVVAAQVTYLVIRLDRVLPRGVGSFSTRRIQRAYGFATLASPLFLLALGAVFDLPHYFYIPFPTPRFAAGTLARFFVGYGTVPLAVSVAVLVLVGTLATLAAVRFDATTPLDFDSSLRATLRRARVDVGDDGLALAAVAFLVPFFGPVLVSYLVVPVFWPRYVIAASVGLFLLVGLGVRTLPRESLQVAAVALLVVAVVPMTGVYHTTDQKEEWREAGNVVEENAHSGDLVLLMDRISEYALTYYVDREDVERGTIVGASSGTGYDANTSAEIAEKTVGHDRVWLFLNHGTDEERERVLTAVRGSRTQVFHRQFFQVELYLFDRSPDAASGTDSDSAASTEPAAGASASVSTSASASPATFVADPGVTDWRWRSVSRTTGGSNAGAESRRHRFAVAD